MPDGGGLTILCFDDSEATLTLMAWTLAEYGHEVHTATTAAAALSVVTSCDLVIIDFHMPGMDGASALEVLKPRAPAESTLFYLYTGDDTAANSCKDLGFDGAFTDKGDISALPAQVDVAARRLRLRQFRKRRLAT